MSEDLRLAIKAEIPMVRVRTDDPVNAEAILDYLTDKPVTPWTGKLSGKSDCVIWCFPADMRSEERFTPSSYNALMEKSITLVMFNADPDEYSYVLDAGELTPPLEYVKETLGGILPKKQVEKFARYFVGLPLTKMLEAVMLTQARDGALTVAGINHTKSYLGHGVAGLEALDTVQTGYVPPQWAKDWLENDALFFEFENLQEFWPRGFLLHGPPGTGKTEAARYIARSMSLPIYKLDGGSVYSRWQGESEANLRRALSFITNAGDCVFLIDEADKLFSHKAEGQASNSTMLSILLWWLQAQSNKAVTVMTANDLSIIPPELFRPGRLDSVHEMRGLGHENAIKFAAQAVKSFAQYGISPNLIMERAIPTLNHRFSLGKEAAQAEIIYLLRQTVKKMILETKHAEKH